MGMTRALRSIDFVSAVRCWPSAHAEYTSRGLAVGESVDPEAHPGMREDDRRVREAADELRASIEGGNDDQALTLLSLLWEEHSGATLQDALAAVSWRKLALRSLEHALPALVGDIDRIMNFAKWLEHAPPLDLIRPLYGEAAEMTAPPPKRNWFSRAYQSRAMEAWTRLYDATAGFKATPKIVADEMLRLADEPGYSRMMLSILLPVFAQSMEHFSSLEDRRSAMHALLHSMASHAKTGTWPSGVDVAIRVVRGDETVTLPLTS